MLDLTRLVAQPEGQYFDRKSLWHGPRDARRVRKRALVRDAIAQYVAAFANADGGTLVLGVEDDGAVTGHGYPDEAVEAFLRVPEQRLSPPQPAGRRALVGEHEVLVFAVAPTERAVMVTGDGFPRRVHDEVVQESEENINAIKARVRAESLEAEAVGDKGLDVLDPEALARARERAGLAALSDADYLIERRLADPRGDGLVLRRGALFLFARRARDIDHPNAGVRIFRVDGDERLTGARHNVQEMPRLEGALPTVIRRAYEAIGALVRRSARLHDLFFRELPEYPTFAWQEALVNAVAHRDYRHQGRGVEVWLYTDRMEIVSPGALLPEIALAKLKRREPAHASRNPRMTRVLAELGLMREQGEGIPRMFEEMERSLLKLPELRADERGFTVVLRNTPIFDTPDPEWARHVRGLGVSLRQRRALVAYAGRAFKNADYQALNEVDRDQAYRELRELVERGLLATEGHGRGVRYRVDRVVTDEAERSPREVLAAVMKGHGSIRNGDYREVFEVDRHAATRTLSQLAEDGVLIRRGERRGAHYLPGPGWDAWIEAARED